MAIKGGTGNGATLTLATTGAVGNIRDMTLPNWVLEKIDASHLGTEDFMQYLPGDLVDPGEITASIVWDEADAMPDLDGVAETVTVTFPGNDTLIGTGFITGYQMPTLENNALMVSQITIAFDGDTGPAYAAGAGT